MPIHLEVPAPVQERLLEWARWCRRAEALPSVRCRSQESRHNAEAGNVHEGLVAVLGRGLPQPEHGPMRVELRVMRLPDVQRRCLRLHYVERWSVPLPQRLKILGVSEEGYWVLRYRSAMATADA